MWGEYTFTYSFAYDGHQIPIFFSVCSFDLSLCVLTPYAYEPSAMFAEFGKCGGVDVAVAVVVTVALASTP